MSPLKKSLVGVVLPYLRPHSGKIRRFKVLLGLDNVPTYVHCAHTPYCASRASHTLESSSSLAFQARVLAENGSRNGLIVRNAKDLWCKGVATSRVVVACCVMTR